MSAEPSNAPVFFSIGATHHTTPIELREKLALTGDKLVTFNQSLRETPGLQEFAVLNTCNRVEFYGVAQTSNVLDHVSRTFCQLQGLLESEFTTIRHQLTGRDALQHLLEVASGLNSQMVGETEILGQVKDAYAAAQGRHSAGPLLNRIFQKTFQYAKYVRSNTAITQGQISVANVAVDLATKIFGELGSGRVLLLGAGDIGEKTAKAFQSRGANSLTVASRTIEHAMDLARTLGAVALPFELWPQKLAEFDIVVCSTSAPDIVVHLEQVRTAMRKRPARPLFFIDLALPRDVEAAAASEENVFLYNLDDLARIAEENLAARSAEVKRARQILDEKASSLWDHLSQSGRLGKA